MFKLRRLRHTSLSFKDKWIISNDKNNIKALISIYILHNIMTIISEQIIIEKNDEIIKGN
jgi:hypothetical protein